MDFELSEELIAVRDLARDFAEKEIAPTASKDDKERAFRGDLVKKMGELGFYGSVIPETYGGNGLGFLAMVLITEEIARVHSAMRVAINMQIGPALAVAAVRHRRTKTAMDTAFGARRQHRLFCHHRTRRWIGCGGHAHDGDKRQRWLRHQRHETVDL